MSGYPGYAGSLLLCWFCVTDTTAAQAACKGQRSESPYRGGRRGPSYKHCLHFEMFFSVRVLASYVSSELGKLFLIISCVCTYTYTVHIHGKQKCLFTNMEPLYLLDTFFPSIGIESLRHQFCNSSIRICLGHQIYSYGSWL